ncbi:flagellar assembly protein H [Novosphingobium sp. Rr 2-17]|uniref:FliH/SctL family protein n=1 Tax=Novosphingobium sp. Rr 2-17 TaxID=555793 RepID=UPI0002699538|nr:FliH/SctL family protein [Novosphingobium sp. Rr 2-17]EIZ78723.1 flagellar assembly protein H [Novosphingobium sp. Rr 2-17]
MPVHATPFAFDRVFTLPKVGEVVPDAALEVITLRDELERLKQQFETSIEVARADGFEAGLAQARGETAVALLAATDALHASIEAVEDEYAAIEQRLSKVAADVAMAAAEALAAQEIEANPARAIDKAISRVLLQVARGQELYIHVNPALLEQMEALLVERQSRDRRRLSLKLLADPALAIGDAVIAWEQGGLALNAAARRAAIRAELGLPAPGEEVAALPA